jgi:hypothetical protein
VGDIVIQNNFLTNDLSEDEDLDDHLRDYETEKIVRPKQVIYWLNFVTRRRRRRRRREGKC